MSQQYRAQGEEAEMLQLRMINARLTLYVAASNAYFGPFPPSLDKRMSTFIQAKINRGMPLSGEKMLAQITDMIEDYKRNLPA